VAVEGGPLSVANTRPCSCHSDPALSILSISPSCFSRWLLRATEAVVENVTVRRLRAVLVPLTRSRAPLRP
jgi:hypothetical protein